MRVWVFLVFATILSVVGVAHASSPTGRDLPSVVSPRVSLKIDSPTSSGPPSEAPKGIPVIVNDDGYSNFTDGHYKDRASLVSALKAAYSGGNVSILEWTLGPCGTFTYGTKIGDVIGDGVKAFPRSGDAIASRVVHDMIAKGDDPLKVVIETCRQINVETFISFRMNAVYPPPFEFFNGRWFDQHPEYKIISINGKPSLNFSYAYSEVRDFRLKIIKEALAYSPDGLNLDFNRHPPFFGYEPGLISEFKRRYGDLDPRILPADDSRWFALRATYLTSFVRECRGALDATGPGKQLSVRIDAVDWHRYACDIPLWIKEGLVDIVIPTRHEMGGFDIDLAPFVAMCKGTKCQIYFGEENALAGHDLTPAEDKAIARGEKFVSASRALSMAQYRERALRWVAAGATGIHIFNAPLRPAIYETVHHAKK